MPVEYDTWLIPNNREYIAWAKSAPILSDLEAIQYIYYLLEAISRTPCLITFEDFVIILRQNGIWCDSIPEEGFSDRHIHSWVKIRSSAENKGFKKLKLRLYPECLQPRNIISKIKECRAYIDHLKQQIVRT